MSELSKYLSLLSQHAREASPRFPGRFSLPLCCGIKKVCSWCLGALVVHSGREPGLQVPSSSSLRTGRQLDLCEAEKTTSAPQLHPSQATTEEAFKDCSEFTQLYESYIVDKLCDLL